MTNTLVLQRFVRVPLLGIEVDFRLNIADEPLLEAEQLGVLLEYKPSRMCRRLVRQMMDDGRLSCTACSDRTPQNAADNSTFHETDRPVADVYSVEVIEPHGVRLGTTEQLWLTERACLLVATASETERAWQVRTALVDFFLEARRQRVAHSETAANAAAQRMLDEARALHANVVEQLELDARLRRLEQRRERKPRPSKPAEQLVAVVTRVLAEHPEGLTTTELLEVARADIDDACGRRIHVVPLGRELGRLASTGHPIERRWRHGHVSFWVLKHATQLHPTTPDSP